MVAYGGGDSASVKRQIRPLSVAGVSYTTLPPGTCDASLGIVLAASMASTPA